jgi:hypothetical protein
MLAYTSIIAQAVEPQGIKKSFLAVMLVSYAGLHGRALRSSATFRTTLAAASQLGLCLVLAWVRRSRSLGAPGRRVGLDGLQAIVDTSQRATDLGLAVRRVKEPLDPLY